MLPIQNHAIAWTNAYLLSDQTYVKFGSVYKKKKIKKMHLKGHLQVWVCYFLKGT